MGGMLAVRNRPPTRMYWWWSHGVPTMVSGRAAATPRDRTSFSLFSDFVATFLVPPSRTSRCFLALHSSCFPYLAHIPPADASPSTPVSTRASNYQGFPMVAYVEGAERAGYPSELMNLTRAIDLPAALCALAPPEARRCLRAAALRGASLTSPQYSAQELIAALCEVAQACGIGGAARQAAGALRKYDRARIAITGASAETRRRLLMLRARRLRLLRQRA